MGEDTTVERITIINDTNKEAREFRGDDVGRKSDGEVLVSRDEYAGRGRILGRSANRIPDAGVVVDVREDGEKATYSGDVTDLGWTANDVVIEYDRSEADP